MHKKILKELKILIVIFIFIIIISKFSNKIFYKKFEIFKLEKPVFIVDYDDKKMIKQINNNECYNFSIQNYINETVSEIALEYTIEIISNDDRILIELYNGEEKVKLQNLKTEKNILKANDKIKKEYKLKIKCKDDEIINEDIKIKVHLEQS